jgi:hypothetical protein
MKRRSVVSFVSILLMLSACDIFSTRTPEPPQNSNTFIWTPATTVETLVANFVGTLTALDPSNYTRCFIASTDSTGSGAKAFTFKPRTGLDPASQSIFTNWTVDGPTESERAWLAKLAGLLPNNSQLSVSLGLNTPIENSNTTASLTTSYIVAVPQSSGSVVADTARGSFEMQFQLVTTEQGTKEWRIVSWSDFPPSSGTSETWTDLKVKLSS